jgi:ABC-type transport system involved in multi-copper enzyme maturation permease subunit
MKIRALTWLGFLSLLRNRLIILFVAGFVCIVLLMMAPLIQIKSMAGDNAAQAQGMLLFLMSTVMTGVSGFGSLLAAWSAAYAVASEMRSGTVMALMARPVRRWEFLLSKYLAVQMLMAVYILFMFAISNVLVWIAGQRIVTNPWLLFVYPMVRYAIYSAMAICFVTMMSPIFAFIGVLLASVLASLVSPASSGAMWLPEWISRGLFVILPSVNLLSESQFIAITASTLHHTPWSDHLTAVMYGMDYALVLFLLAAWSFRRRSLCEE